MRYNNKTETLKKGVTPVEACVAELLFCVDSYKLTSHTGGTGGDNAFYGAVVQDDKGLTLKTNQYPCHKYMMYHNKPEAVFNRYAHRPQLSTEIKRNFFDWITSDEGPWKEFSGRKTSHLPSDVPPEKALDWMYDNGWVWSDLSCPSNLQHSFLVASRMQAEWPLLITKWNEWQGKFKCHPKYTEIKALSFLFLDVFRVQEKNNLWKINYANLYDWPLDVCTAGEEYVKNFVYGKVESLNPPYKDNPMYRPVNRIFGDNEPVNADHPRYNNYYPSVIFRLYNGENGTSLKLGQDKKTCEKYFTGNVAKESSLGFTSGFDYGKNWCVSEDDILKIIEMEAERIKDVSGIVSNTEQKARA